VGEAEAKMTVKVLNNILCDLTSKLGDVTSVVEDVMSVVGDVTSVVVGGAQVEY
jgi:hypothetical protein